jgi:MFS transporter, SP family, general alpha glucoside:H+ symporter
MAVPVGNVFGITLNASLTERFGHKKILICALVVLSGLITIQFRATSIQQLFVGQILCGVPWGMFTTTQVFTSLTISCKTVEQCAAP